MSSGIFAFVIAGILLVVAVLLFLPIRRSENHPVNRGPVFRDDSRYWIGIIYYNPDDPDVIVPKRYGFGWTVNFGHPTGKLIAIVLLIMLLLPLILMFIPGLSQGCHQLTCIR